MNGDNIKKILVTSNIKKGDTVILHGNLGSINQIQEKSLNKLSFFFNVLISYLGKRGTILVPSFTYSFCKKENFNVQNSKTYISDFSEKCRHLKIFHRSYHPIFSFLIYGFKKKYYLNSDLTTCFGVNSIFDLIKKDNAKLCGLGCKLDGMLTFMHHIEEEMNIKYRYLKFFSGYTIDKNKKQEIKTTYFVRKKNIIYNFANLEKKIKKIINIVNFGRYTLMTIEAQKIFFIIKKNLKKNDTFLIN